MWVRSRSGSEQVFLDAKIWIRGFFPEIRIRFSLRSDPGKIRPDPQPGFCVVKSSPRVSEKLEVMTHIVNLGNTMVLVLEGRSDIGAHGGGILVIRCLQGICICQEQS